jgi:hypothetical protein
VGGRKHLIFVAQLPGVQALLVQEKVIRSACNSERKPSRWTLRKRVALRPRGPNAELTGLTLRALACADRSVAPQFDL